MVFWWVDLVVVIGFLWFYYFNFVGFGLGWVWCFAVWFRVLLICWVGWVGGVGVGVGRVVLGWVGWFLGSVGLGLGF